MRQGRAAADAAGGLRRRPVLREKEAVRFQTIRNARIENVGQSQSCMVFKLRIVWKQNNRSRIARAPDGGGQDEDRCDGRDPNLRGRGNGDVA